MMSRLTIFLIFTFYAVSLSAKPLNVAVKAKSAILMNAGTGAVLFEKNSNRKSYPASTTKIFTAICALETFEGQLDKVLTATADAIGSIKSAAKVKADHKLPSWWVEVGSTHVGIKKGEKLSLRTLLYGALVASGNDACNVISSDLGEGSIPKGIERINAYLKDHGCASTHLKNPHGLHHPEHYTTAYDLAKVTKHALKNPLFRKIVGTTKFRRPKSNKQDGTVWVQSNRLITNTPYYYEPAIGVKTGFTSKASHCLVAAAEREGRTLIAVVLGCPKSSDKYKDAKALFEAAFAEKPMEKMVLSPGKQPHILELDGLSIPSYLEQGVKLRYFPSEEPDLKVFLEWDEVQIPIAQGERMGDLKVYDQSKTLLASVPLLAATPVRSSWLYQLFGFHNHSLIAFGIAGVMLGFLLIWPRVFQTKR